MSQILKRLRGPLLGGAVAVGAMMSFSAVAEKSEPGSVVDRMNQLSQQADLLSQDIFQLQQGLGYTPPTSVGANAPVIKVSQSREFGAINVRLDQLENQMRLMNGQVEGLQFQVTQLQTLIERMQEDYDYRFQELEGGGLGKTSAAPQPDSATPSERLPQAQTSSDQAPAAELNSTVQTLGTLSTDQNGQPLDLNFNPGTSLSDADAEAQYEAGYEAILRGDYEFAKDQFSQYVALFPNHRQAADGHHWLGEALMQSGEYEEAAEIFLAGFERYPNATRAPDMVLKLGIVLSKTGERETACRTFVELLRKYPDQPQAFKGRVREEQQKAQC